jgi:hypothetical protein
MKFTTTLVFNMKQENTWSIAQITNLYYLSREVTFIAISKSNYQLQKA